MDVPQSPQKDLLTPGADSYTFGVPRLISIRPTSYPTNSESGAPFDLRQSPQWQYTTASGSPRAVNLTAPHRHPPLFMFSELRDVPEIERRTAFGCSVGVMR